MSQKAPLPNSVGRAPRQAQKSSSDTTGVIITVTACLVALGAAYLLKGQPSVLAGSALVATVTAIAFAFFSSRSAPAAGETGDDAVASLKSAIDTNRSECTSRLAELRKSVDAVKAGRGAGSDSGAVQDEIAKLRAEVAGLRGIVNSR